MANIQFQELLESRDYEATDVVLPPSWSAKSGETIVQQTARLEEEKSDANHRRRKEFILFAAGVIGGALIFVAALWFLFDPNTKPEQRSWAQATLLGLIGLALGTQVNRPEKKGS